MGWWPFGPSKPEEKQLQITEDHKYQTTAGLNDTEFPRPRGESLIIHSISVRDAKSKFPHVGAYLVKADKAEQVIGLGHMRSVFDTPAIRGPFFWPVGYKLYIFIYTNENAVGINRTVIWSVA